MDEDIYNDQANAKTIRTQTDFRLLLGILQYFDLALSLFLIRVCILRVICRDIIVSWATQNLVEVKNHMLTLVVMGNHYCHLWKVIIIYIT